MLPTTRDAIRSVIKTDPTVNTEARKRIIVELLRAVEAPPQEASPHEARLLKRRQCAERLNCSLTAIDRLAREGLLPKRKFPGRKRASGIAEADLLALMQVRPVASAPSQTEGA